MSLFRSPFSLGLANQASCYVGTWRASWLAYEDLCNLQANQGRKVHPRRVFDWENQMVRRGWRYVPYLGMHILLQLSGIAHYIFSVI
jgi:hypothetical protein